MTFVPGSSRGPIGVGSEAEWRIRSPNVAPLACYLLFDGDKLFVAGMSRGVLLDGQAVGREWSTINAPATIQVGDATISVTPGAALAAAAASGEEEATINTGSTPTNWPLERDDGGGSVNEVTVYEPRVRAATPPKADEPVEGERTDDTIASRTKRRRRLRRMGIYVATAVIVVIGAMSRMQGGRGAPMREPAASEAPQVAAPPPNAPVTQPVTQPRAIPAAPSATVATRTGAPSAMASSAPPPGGRAAPSPSASVATRAGAASSASPSPAAPASSALADTAPARPGSPASRAAAAKAKDMKTLEQRAVQAAASGAFLDAARLYEELARNYPDNPVYSEAARILAARGAEATSTEPRP